MKTIKDLHHYIDSCNGEIRIQAVRYGQTNAWYCLCAIIEPEEKAFECFEDLVGGDNDYFEAVKYFAGGDVSKNVYCIGDVSVDKHEHCILSMGDSPMHALGIVYKKALEIDGYEVRE